MSETATYYEIGKQHREGKRSDTPYHAWAHGYAGSWHKTERAAANAIRRYCRSAAKASGGPAPTGRVIRVAEDWSYIVVRWVYA